MKLNRNNRILFAVLLILSGRLRRETERKKTCTDDELAVTDCPVINSETQNNSTASGRTMDQSGRDHNSEEKSEGENGISETGNEKDADEQKKDADESSVNDDEQPESAGDT